MGGRAFAISTMGGAGGPPVPVLVREVRHFLVVDGDDRPVAQGELDVAADEGIEGVIGDGARGDGGLGRVDEVVNYPLEQGDE